jgi:hypothetical protein
LNNKLDKEDDKVVELGNKVKETSEYLEQKK